MSASARLRSLLLLASLLPLAASALPPYLVDGDGDGVSDEIDECPYTHPGVQVDAKGCPLSRDDGDGDGVPDEDDDCPYSAPGAIVDARGCALDSDFDGVADGIDRCPRTPLAQPVDARGCAAGERAETATPASAPRKPAAPVKPPVVAASPAPQSLPPAVIAAPVLAPTVAAPATGSDKPAAKAESPELSLRFAQNSTRLSRSDLALVESYARIFARRLAADTSARLHIRAYADHRESDVAALVTARTAAVREALVQKGIAPERIQADSGVLRDGDVRRNRRVDVTLGD